MAFLRLFGYPSLELEQHGSAPARATQRHRMALLALLATSKTGWSRDKVIGMLWPESPSERARNSLSESLYVLRRALGELAIVSSGDELRFGPEAPQCDVREFEAAISAGELSAAVGLYSAPFLDGFFVARAPDLERWAEAERGRLRSLYANALEKLAATAAAAGDVQASVEWWRKRASVDVQDGRVAMALMNALVAAGDRVGALNHARIHAALVRDEFGVEPDPRLVEMERALRSGEVPARASAQSSPARAADRPTLMPAPVVVSRAKSDAILTPIRASSGVLWLTLAVAAIVLIAALVRSTDGLQRSSDERSLPPSPAAALTNDNAYALYSRGHAQLASHREPETRAAVASFEAAIARDTNFALAHAGLAIAAAEMHLRFASANEAPRWGEVAVREARRALVLDSSLADVHEALAAVHRKSEFDWDGTIRESREALRLNPKATMPHFYIGGALYHLGMLAEADRAVRVGLDGTSLPDRAEALRTLGTVVLADGRYAEAVSLFQTVQRLSDRPVSDPNLAAAYYYVGDTTRAIQLLETLVTSSSASAASRARAFLASILAARGDRARAQALIDRSTAGQVDHHVAYSIGVANAQLGRPSESVRWLRIAWETGFRCYPWYERDPLLAPLRGNREFNALLRELSSQHAQDTNRYRGVA
jgi:DNA-binding SARP family transcriptional activator/Tfp pilus assembly protein PilF